MTPERWERIGAIFGEASELASSEREAFLDRACEGDAALRAEVAELLARHDRSQVFVDSPAGGEEFARRLAAAGASFHRTFQPEEVIGGRFRIERLIGEGGMGEVYAAFDKELGTRVALKTLHGYLADDDRFATRFRKEVQIARQVTHPNVCRIFDAGRQGETLFLTMELLEGETLAAHIQKKGHLEPAQALPIVRQICSGLTAAHAAGVVHRDLKPGNIMLLDGRAVITDFGLARISASPAAGGVTTSAAVAIGTPAYMAPEQMEGAASTPAVDIYALGVVIYEMLTGRRPYSDDLSPLALAVKKVKEPPTPPRHWKDVPPLWERVILKCLAGDPNTRFASAVEVVEALEGLRSVRLATKRDWRRWAWPLGGAVAGALLLWLGWTLFGGRLQPPAGVEAWYREGVHALHDGNPATAQRALARVVERAPDWAAGHARLAQAYKELDQLDLARESVLQALRVQGWFDPGADLVRAVQSLVTLDFRTAASRFRRVAGRQSGAERWDGLLDQARALEQGDQPAEAMRVVNEILTADADAPSANLLRAQLAARMKSKPEAIRPYFDKALAGFRSLNRMEALSQGQTELSLWLFRQKEVDAAQVQAQQALVSARAAQSPYAEAKALLHLARIADTSSDPAQARQYIEQAQAIAARERFGELEVQGFIDLGIQQNTQGRAEMAYAEFQKAVVQAGRVRSPRGMARAQYWSGVALRQLRRNEDALQAYRKAAAGYREIGYPREALRARVGEAAMLQRLDDWAGAKAVLHQAQEEVANLGDVDMTVTVTVARANLAADTGDHPPALVGYLQWLDLAKTYGIQQDICIAGVEAARTEVNLGRFADARQHLQAVAANDRCRQAQQVTARGLVEGLLLVEEGQYAKALAHYREMLRVAEENKQASRVTSLKNFICTASVFGEPPEKARKECGETFRKPANARASATSHYVAADLFLLAGEYDEAIHRANMAREALRKQGNLDDTLYSTLIRGQAEVRAGRDVRETRQELERLRGLLVASWGEGTVAQYLKRSLYAKRWDEVFGPVRQ